MAEPFKLSASLPGHDDDVRDVVFPTPSLVISASRDATVRLWKLAQPSSAVVPRIEADISSHVTSFVNAVAFIPPSADFPLGLVVSGGKDGLLDVRSPDKRAEQDADALLPAHEGNVCALDVSADGSVFVSGSWDTTACVWRTGRWEPFARLEGHEASVWAVLAYSNDVVITGSADKYIRVFDVSGRLLKRFQASDDVIRALVKLPENHESGAQFASAGNDSRIRLWTLEGVFMGELFGHENFIYSLDVLPSGEIVSSSEDRTVRIWKGSKCVQTITHPAISVWSVAVNQESGDIATGSSDKIVRVFSRAAERHADAEQLRLFEQSVQASSIPQQSLGEINKTDLPGPEFLQNKSGTKEGQIQLIKETNGNVMAYQWSTQGNTWVSVGTVVDSAGSATKVTYNGKDYDYVFDVDIEDGKPPLKLPYNVTQSPFEVARKFIEDNKLPMTYVDSVVDFINQNTKGASLGSQPASSNNTARGADPWGTESRYRPDGNAQQPSASAPAVTQSIIPQKAFLAISTGSHKMVLKKLQEYNEAFKTEGRKDLVLQPQDLNVLIETIAKLEPEAGKQESSIDVSVGAVNATLRAIQEWPVDKRLPWLDLLRLLVAASAQTITHAAAYDPPHSLIHILARANAFDSAVAPDNNIMLAVRTLANLFCSEPGCQLADSAFDRIIELVAPYNSTPNRNLAIALTTLYINLAVLLLGHPATPAQAARDGVGDADRALTLLHALAQVLNATNDSEALYRALVAAGTVLGLGSDFAELAKDELGLQAAVERAQGVAGTEARIARVAKEVLDILGV